MYGDTAAIRRLADQMRQQAGDVRAEAEGLLGAVEQVLWEGRAAEAMRASTAERSAALRRTADQHDEAADALARHAAEVDQLTDLIAGISRRVTAMADDLLPTVDLPPLGHRDWLGIPDQLSGLLR